MVSETLKPAQAGNAGSQNMPTAQKLSITGTDPFMHKISTWPQKGAKEFSPRLRAGDLTVNSVSISK
jgi:hypothetical protein